jgi:hypothetical protein
VCTAWRNLENNALSSLHLKLRKRLLSVCFQGGGGRVLYLPPSLLAGSVTIYAKTSVHFSPDSPIVYGFNPSGIVLYICLVNLYFYINAQDSETNPAGPKDKEDETAGEIEPTQTDSAEVAEPVTEPPGSSISSRCEALVSQLDVSLQLARDLASTCKSEADREAAGRAAVTVRERLADLGRAVDTLAPPPHPTSVTSLYGKVYQLKKS